MNICKQVNVKFTVLGEPVAKGRPRFSSGIVYTDKKTKTYEKLIAWHAADAMRKAQLDLFEGEVDVLIRVMFKVPKSWPNYKKKDALEGRLKPYKTRKDLSNVLKAVEDGMNGIVYKDDKQICVIYCEKVYGPEEKVDISIYGEV